MKRLLICVLIITVTAYLGIKLQQGAGHVLITYNNLSIEMTLGIAVLSLILILFTFYLCLRVWQTGSTLTKQLLKWPQHHRQKKAKRQLEEGLRALITGNWPLAEKRLVSAAEQFKQWAYLHYLSAARAALAQGATDRCQRYIDKAKTHAKDDNAQHVVTISHIRLLLENYKYHEALTHLKPLHNRQPKQAVLLSLLYRAYLGLENRQALIDLLPALHKHKALPASELAKLERKLNS